MISTINCVSPLVFSDTNYYSKTTFSFYKLGEHFQNAVLVAELIADLPADLKKAAFINVSQGLRNKQVENRSSRHENKKANRPTVNRSICFVS